MIVLFVGPYAFMFFVVDIYDIASMLTNKYGSFTLFDFMEGLDKFPAFFLLNML